jgi:outer membrane protein assembly factor BamE
MPKGHPRPTLQPAAPRRAVARAGLLLAAAALAAGCSVQAVKQSLDPTQWVKPHTIEIQQGNYVSQEMISKLQPGMSRDQVRFIMGTPLVADPFNADRWDYVYTRRAVRSTETEQRRVSVFFKDSVLDRVDGDVVPPQAAPAAASAPEAASTPAPAAAPRP